MADEQAVVATETTDLAVSSLLTEMAEFAGAGSENVTNDAMAMPYVALAQAKTPIVEQDPENYKAGMLIHSITGKGYDIREKGGKPLRALLCHFGKAIVEWGDKDRGTGGLKFRHPCTADRLALLETLPKSDKGKRLAPNANNALFPLRDRQEGNILEETAYHYLLLLPEDGSLDVANLPLKSTGLTPSKKLIRMLDSRPLQAIPGRKPFAKPYFATVVTIQSFLDQQKAGARNYFQNVRFELAEDLADETTFRVALAFYKSIQGGVVRLDDAAEGGVDTTDHTSHDPGPGASGYNDDETPF